MKKRARETEETPQQIISQSVALLSEQAAVAMPPIHHIRRDIPCQRKRASNQVETCTSGQRFSHPSRIPSDN